MFSESDNKIRPKIILLSLVIPFLTAKKEQNQGSSESDRCLERKTFFCHCVIGERYKIPRNSQMALQINHAY